MVHGLDMREHLCSILEVGRMENCSLESVHRVDQGQERETTVGSLKHSLVSEGMDRQEAFDTFIKKASLLAPGR